MRAICLVLLMVQVCWGFTGRGVVYPGRYDLFELSVIHINDFHARFEQTGPTSGACREGAEDDCVGGVARLYTATHQLVKERPNAIFLNAGDHFQGTLWYNIYGWNVTATFMNLLPHDAMTIGNHEFDNGIAGVVPFMKMVKAPVLVANIDDSQEPTMQGLYQNSTIIVRNGTKIGVIGIILSTTDKIANTEKLKFYDEVETVNAEAKKLKAQGVNIIIVLSHTGLQVDKIMAAKCPLVDVIVGGHSHTFLYSGESPYDDTPEDDYPVVVEQEKTNRTVLVVQAAAFSKYVGNLTVWFDEQGEVVDWEGNPILMDYSIEQDPKILEALKPWAADVNAVSTKVVGTTKVLLNRNSRRGENGFGNLITDAMVDTYVDKAENEKFWTYAAISCANIGGIRAPIEEITSNITYGDLMMALPFENTWDTVELNGTIIRQILEMGVLRSYNDDYFVARGELLLWSGLKVTYNLSNERYKRVTEVKVRCRDCEVPRYGDLIDNEWYRIVVLSYVYNGGDNYGIFKETARNHRVGTRDVDNMIAYVKKMSPIISGIDGRLTLNGKWRG